MTETSLLPQDLVDLATRVIHENAAISRRVVLAESCTGGLAAAALTEIAGSSAVLEASFVAYSNLAKQQILGVSSDIIDTFGAVSPACVWAMAQGALKRSEADVAVAISGVAGPDGGTKQKPVGLVVFSRAERGQTEATTEERCFTCDRGGFLTRAEVRHRAALVALELLLPPPER